MRGSGLSIERFIKGKAQRSKRDAKSKKKVLIHKAKRRRQYEKVKKECQDQTGLTGGQGETDTSKRSFYDKFFNQLRSGEGDDDETKEVDDTRRGKRREEQEEEEEQKDVVKKPDPFYKAKKKAAVMKMEQQRAREEKQKRLVATEKKVIQRKKRHVKLSQRTVTGQPVMKNHIHDILSRLQTEKKKPQM